MGVVVLAWVRRCHLCSCFWICCSRALVLRLSLSFEDTSCH